MPVSSWVNPFSILSGACLLAVIGLSPLRLACAVTDDLLNILVVMVLEPIKLWAYTTDQAARMTNGTKFDYR